MRKTLPVMAIAIFVLPIFATAQDAELLKNFKYRINNFTAYNFLLSSSNDYTNRSINTGMSSNENSNHVSGSLFRIKSTDKLLLELNTSVYGNTGFSKSDDDKYSSLSSGIEVNVNARHYKNSFFIETGGTLLFSNSLSKWKNNGENANRTNYYNPGVNIVLGIGKGRAENVTDMQNALWLYKELQIHNQLKRQLTNEELNELGKTVTLANNTRVLDYRRQVQYRLKTIHQFFQKNELIENMGIDYYNSLNDILFYAFNNRRLSGKEWSFKISPGIRYTNANTKNYFSDNVNKEYNTNGLLQARAGYTVYKPKSLTRQVNYGVAISGSVNKYKNTIKRLPSSGVVTENTYRVNTDMLTTHLFSEWAFYPNTRTNIVLGVFADNGVTGYDKLNNYYCNNGIKTEINYFISYNTRLQASFNTAYTKNYPINTTLVALSNKGRFANAVSATLQVSL